MRTVVMMILCIIYCQEPNHDKKKSYNDYDNDNNNDKSRQGGNNKE